MSRRFQLRRAVSGLFVLATFAGADFWILRAQPGQQKQNPNFTGTVIRIEDKTPAQPAHFRFEPGSRTKWHSHEGGQIILVEEGVGLYQNKGGPVMELHAGETTYCPPNVVHWHGAAPDQGGVQFNVSRGGITWLDEVTEKEYTAPRKH